MPRVPSTGWVANTQCQIIVEGGDDAIIFQLLEAGLRASGETVVPHQVHSAESQGKIAAKLAEFAATDAFIRNVRSLVLVVDADDAPDVALKAMQRALADAGMQPPASAGVWHATALHGIARSVRIELVPASGPGSMESLILAGVVPQHIACVDAFFACVADFGKPKPTQWLKAQVQALAAAKLTDGYTRLGVAMRDQVFSVEHPAFDGLRTLLRSLPTPAE